VRSTCEVEEVCSLGLVELKRTSERFQNGLRSARHIAALEARVVIDADPGEERDFLPAEPWNTPLTAEVRRPDCSGVILARLEVRNSRISFLVSTGRG